MASVAAMPLVFALDAPLPVVATSSLFPTKLIRKSETVYEWPFSIDEGELTCIGMNGQKFVFFAEILSDEEMGEFGSMKLPKSVVVTTNPMAFFASFEDRDLYLPWDTLETLIRRLAPYERMGWALCDAADKTPQTDQH
jgi:hypothetical protein